MKVRKPRVLGRCWETNSVVERQPKTPKGMTQPPLPHPLQLLFCFVCRFSQSCDDWQSPRSPGHRVTFKATLIQLAMFVPGFWPARVAVSLVIG